MSFTEARQGKGPVHRKSVRPAFLLIGVGIAYSHIFYPVRPRPDRAAAAVTPIRSAGNLDLISGPSFSADTAERITIAAIRGHEGSEAEARLTAGLKLLIEIGRRHDHQEMRG
jgi:hypothetical protein